MNFKHLALAAAMSSVVLTGCGKDESKVEIKTHAEKVSYGIGYSMGNNFRDEGITDLSPGAIAAGVADALAQQEQRVSDEELMESFEFVQQRTMERMNAVNDENARTSNEFLDKNAQREEVTVTDSGLQYEILQQAEGATPGPQDVVMVHYHGTLVDGTVFDSSVERGMPAEFPVGAVIPGWVEGLQLMSVGAKYRFYIPSELAYGSRSPSPAIPPNSALIFDVELLGIAGLEEQQAEQEVQEEQEAVEQQEAVEGQELE